MLRRTPTARLTADVGVRPQRDPCSGSDFSEVLVFLSPQFSFWLNEGGVQPLPARTPVDISLRCRERLHNRVPGQASIKNPLRGPFLSLPFLFFFGSPTRARTELTGSVQIMALLARPPTSAEKRTWTRRRRPRDRTTFWFDFLRRPPSCCRAADQLSLSHFPISMIHGVTSTLTRRGGERGSKQQNIHPNCLCELR